MISSLKPRIRGMILDMDGVLWRDDQSIGNLPDIFAKIRALDIKVAFATNNATRSAGQYQEKLKGFGVQVDLDQIINSSMATAFLLKRRFPEGVAVYVVGEKGLKETLEQYGFYHAESGAQAVVAGMDRQLTFEKLRQATLLIRAGAAFYGTNPDRSFPTPQGLIPGAGSILAAIEAATDVKPLVAGKPFPAMLEMALEHLETSPQETLAVGDRLDTDILGGQRAGCRTALVLTGVATRDEVKNWTPAPDLIAANLESLVD
jgi:4-nitrophenyl phosphatase